MVEPAWDHLIEHFKAESFDAKAGGKWMGKMVKSDISRAPRLIMVYSQ